VQARWAGELLFLSGQIGLEPATGELVSGGAADQARRAMQNLGAVLQAAGLGWEQVVKCTIYLTDMAHFEEVNRVYASFFPEGGPLPARACVAVAALPRGAAVEIEAVARREG
jgi:2-iminobutanoate/2-iminopropanoate deaminase